MYFRNREDAGSKLANLLTKYRGQDAVVFALPRGGVVLGVEVAAALNVPLDLVIPRKIGHPVNPEYAIAAITEHGDLACNEKEIAVIDSAWFRSQQVHEKREAQRRRDLYMNGRKEYSASKKIAILVDDGIATGLTMKAAILDIKRQDPARVIVAIPVVPWRTAIELRQTVDEIVAIDFEQEYLGAVGLYYFDFPQVTDEEVSRLLDRVNPRRLPQPI